MVLDQSRVTSPVEYPVAEVKDVIDTGVGFESDRIYWTQIRDGDASNHTAVFEVTPEA